MTQDVFRSAASICPGDGSDLLSADGKTLAIVSSDRDLAGSARDEQEVRGRAIRRRTTRDPDRWRA
jgi:hypothetical protein